MVSRWVVKQGDILIGRYFDEANFGRWRFGTYGPPYFRGEQIVSSWMRVMAAVFEPTDQAAGALATQLLHS